MLNIPEEINEDSFSSNKQQLPNSWTKTKTSKFKMSKTKNKHAQQNKPPSFPVFNDPLYEHLDNQVYNQEQHNFGPWVQHQRAKSRDHRSHSKIKSQLPPIINSDQMRLRSQLYQINPEGSRALPLIHDRVARSESLSSLRELKASSLDLQTLDSMSPNRLTKQSKSLNKIPFFLKLREGYRIPSQFQSDSPNKRSNVIYNYCLQQDQNRIVQSKIGRHTNKTPSSYLRLMKLDKLSPVKKSPQQTNKALFNQLKQHRLNKLK